MADAAGAAPAQHRRPRIYDEGMQQERTALAWDRTGLAMIVGGALFLRAGDPPYHELRHLPGLAMIALGAVLLVLSFRHYESRDARLRRGGPAAHPGIVRLVGVATVLFTLASAGLVVFGG